MKKQGSNVLMQDLTPCPRGQTLKQLGTAPKTGSNNEQLLEEGICRQRRRSYSILDIFAKIITNFKKRLSMASKKTLLTGITGQKNSYFVDFIFQDRDKVNHILKFQTFIDLLE